MSANAATERKLTPQQMLFCREYVIDRNATQAAIRAGYSEKTAPEQGSRLLSYANVRAEVDRLLQGLAKKLDITAERVLNELAKLAFVDIADIYNEDGGLKQLSEMPEDARRAIVGIEIQEERIDGVVVGQTRKVKLADKKGALVDLGRHLKLFTDKIELDDSSSFTEKLQKARERAKKK